MRRLKLATQSLERLDMIAINRVNRDEAIETRQDRSRPECSHRSINRVNRD